MRPARITAVRGTSRILAQTGFGEPQPKARYRGTRKNLFDLRRIAAVENLDTTRPT